MDEQQKEQIKQVLEGNNSYNVNSVLQTRLNTDPVLDKIENFLKGSVTYYKTRQDGEVEAQEAGKGKRKCNKEGVQAIMSRVSQAVNSQTVQGNLDKNHYDEIIYDMRLSLTKVVMKNLYNWKVVEAEFDNIIDGLMDIIEIFLSRCIDNKERDSYTDTIRHVENSKLVKGNEGFFSGLTKSRR